MTDSASPNYTAQVPMAYLGERLDRAASALFPAFSRARLQAWIKDGQLRVDGQAAKPKQKLLGGETLSLTAVAEAAGDWQPEPLDLVIVYEDDQLLVVNKPAGLVVHPAAGNPSGTLLNGLLHALPGQRDLPRAGIVHRLDKDTTGLMVVAKTLQSHHSLVAQLQARSLGREYLAIACGVLRGGDSVEAAIGRHPRQRQKMAVVSQGGKPAITHYQVLERFLHHSYLRLKLATGRTHQIRVHMAHLGHPLVGDATYGRRPKQYRDLSPALRERLLAFPRQALHAERLTLEHPTRHETLSWQAPMPEDMAALLAALQGEAGNA